MSDATHRTDDLPPKQRNYRSAAPAPPAAPRPTGAALVRALAAAGKPLDVLLQELDRSERVREAEAVVNRERFYPNLDAWNALAEEVDNLPPEVGVALMTSRPQLILSITPERAAAMAPEQVIGLINLVRVLILTNQVLQQHSMRVAKMIDQMDDNMKGVWRKMTAVRHVANFQEPGKDDEDDEE